MVRVILKTISILIMGLLLINPTISNAASKASKPHKSSQSFAFAYKSIHEKYLKEISIEKIAFNTLEGLTKLDKKIKFSNGKTRIYIYYNGSSVGSYPKSKPTDHIGWTKITKKMISIAKSKSYILRQIPHKDIINKMLVSMTDALDKHSKYSPEKSARDEKENRVGFGGIGIRYRKTGNNLEITEIVKGSPAYKAGIFKGDYILKINKVDISYLNRKEIIDAIRGRSGTQLDLTIRNIKNEVKDITLTRRHIIEQTSKARMIDNILYIEITAFNQQTTQDIRNIIQDNEDFEGIVIDLRDNPGGLLKQAVKTAELFIDNGIVVSTKGRHEDSIQFYNAKSGDIAARKPIVLLIDGRTASSAEILAASLLDQSRAITIGTSTYGKGTVQTIISLFNKGELSITWSEFYTPAGYNLNNLGVMPVLCINDEIYDYIGKDPRLAIKHINDINKDVSEEIRNWSKMTNGDIEKKNKLRQICPAKSRYKNEKDLDLALYILKNKIIYDRLKDIVASSN